MGSPACSSSDFGVSVVVKNGGSPVISVVIPTLNAETTIGKCLDAALAQSLSGVEIIVVDGGSKDRTVEIVKERSCRVIVDDAASGPAHGRNRGVAETTGDIVLFVDADVVLAPDVAERVLDCLAAHPDASGVNGVYEPEPANDPASPFDRYMALRKFCNFSGFRTFTHITTACGAIRRSVFDEVGGFDVQFVEMEDIELGYRVTEHYTILLDPEVRCRHFFRPFHQVARRYFKRTLYWLALFGRTRRFGSGITSRGRGIGAMCALAGILMLAIAVFQREPVLAIGSGLLLVPFVVSNHAFYLAAFRREGDVFLIYCITTSLALACVAATATLLYPLIGPSFTTTGPGGGQVHDE